VSGKLVAKNWIVIKNYSGKIETNILYFNLIESKIGLGFNRERQENNQKKLRSVRGVDFSFLV